VLYGATTAVYVVIVGVNVGVKYAGVTVRAVSVAAVGVNTIEYPLDDPY
jgi:hypothetical protein